MFEFNPVDLLIRVPVVLLALTVHEFSHGYFAYRMGDPTAYQQGRVSLNPLRHLDPLGTICLMFAWIGWAKPVPINPLNFRERRKGILVSTAAGPLSNLCQAVVFALLMRGVFWMGGGVEPVLTKAVPPFLYAAFLMTEAAVYINVALAVFNCLPLFPLDGFHITLQLLPMDKQQQFASTARFGPMAVIGLVLLPMVGGPSIVMTLLVPPVEFILTYVAGW